MARALIEHEFLEWHENGHWTDWFVRFVFKRYHLQLCTQKELRTAVRTVMTKLITFWIVSFFIFINDWCLIFPQITQIITDFLYCERLFLNHNAKIQHFSFPTHRCSLMLTDTHRLSLINISALPNGRKYRKLAGDRTNRNLSNLTNLLRLAIFSFSSHLFVQFVFRKTDKNSRQEKYLLGLCSISMILSHRNHDT